MTPLFGTDGIRAKAGEFPLTKEKCVEIGLAGGKVLLSKKEGAKSSNIVLIARDTRSSCSWIEEALSRGLILSGCKVTSCGILPTAAISVLLKGNSFVGGSVISASHNPPEFNGIKFFSACGNKIPESWEREIEEKCCHSGPVSEHGAGSSRNPDIDMFLDSRFRGNDGVTSNSYASRNVHGFSTFPDAESQYIQFLKDSYAPPFSLEGKKWVVDCANGSASFVAPKIFESLGGSLRMVANDPNGENINVGCGALHLNLLRERVVQEKAWGGCAFDGDADRVLFVDEKGEILDGDLLIALAAEYLKEKGILYGNCVVTTVMANFGFFQWMKRAKIDVLTTPVGDRSVSEKMFEVGAKLGGEQSGHIIFSDYLPTGDGLLTALKILEILVKKDKPLSYYKQIYPKTPQVLLNLKVKEKIPVEKIPSLKELIQTCERDLGESGRLLVRYSGTEPLLRIMVEGNSLEVIQRTANLLAESAKKELGT